MKPQAFEKCRAVRFAELLPGLFAAAECDHRLPVCLGRRHSLCDIRLRQFFGVEGDLSIEILVAVGVAEWVSHLSLLPSGAENEADRLGQSSPCGFFRRKLAAAFCR